MSGLSVGRYGLGVLAVLLICASLGGGAALLRRRLLPDWSGAPARLAEIIIALALLTAQLQLLGTLGLFRLVPIVAFSVLLAWVIRRALPPGGGRLALAPATRLRWEAAALTAGAVAAVAAEWAGPTLVSYRYGIRTFDSLWYHLPWAASFAGSGQITTLHFTDVEYLTAFYPATAELFHGLGIVLFGGGDLLSPGLNLLWLGVLLLAAWCAGQALGRGWLALIGGALALAVPMLLYSQAGSAANDVVGVACLLAAVALVLQAPSRAGTVVAAVAAGLAVSVKLSLLAPVAALSVGVLLWRRRDARLWIAPLLLAGGFWYLRNLIAVGNPLPWVELPGLAVPAAALQAHTGFSVAHYLFSAHVWRGLLQPGLASGLGPWWWALLAIVVVGPLLCLLPGSSAQARLAGAVALASTAAYVVTPESAAGPAGHPLGFAFNLRYSAPALALSLVATPLAPLWRRRHAQLLLAAGLGLILLVTLAQARLWPGRFLAAQVLAAGVVLAAALAWRAGLGRRFRGPLALAGGATGLVIIAALGFAGQRSYFRHRYTYQPGISQLSAVWARFRTVRHARVGIVGTYGGFFSYPLFGVLDSNPVRYVAARGPHGSFTPIGSCQAWRRAVNAARLRYLVTTPARDPWHPRLLSPSPERGWTVGDPAATVAFQTRATSQYVTVFRIQGRLHPAGCG